MRKKQLLAGLVFGRPEPHVWTNRSLPASDVYVYDVAYSPKLDILISIGSNSGQTAPVISKSVDGGKTWESVTPPATAVAGAWVSVTWTDYSGGLFVACANATGNNLMTSPDGDNWTVNASLPSGFQPLRIFHDGVYFHAAFASYGYRRSANLSIWEEAVTGPNNITANVGSQCFATNGSRVVMVGTGFGAEQGYYSDDNGVNWTGFTINSAFNFANVLYSSVLNLWVAAAYSPAAGTSTTYIGTSATGIGSWTMRTTHSVASDVGVFRMAQNRSYDDNYRILATLAADSVTQQVVRYSSNGTSWTEATGSITQPCAWGNPGVAYHFGQECFCVTLTAIGPAAKGMTSTTGS